MGIWIIDLTATKIPAYQKIEFENKPMKLAEILAVTQSSSRISNHSHIQDVCGQGF